MSEHLIKYKNLDFTNTSQINIGGNSITSQNISGAYIPYITNTTNSIVLGSTSTSFNYNGTITLYSDPIMPFISVDNFESHKWTISHEVQGSGWLECKECKIKYISHRAEEDISCNDKKLSNILK